MGNNKNDKSSNKFIFKLKLNLDKIIYDEGSFFLLQFFLLKLK